jgi:ribonuclease HI
VGGDFNFVSNPSEDTTSNSKYGTPTTTLYDAWNGFITHFKLQEIHQQTHTFQRLCDDAKQSSTARLDRLYTSHTGAEREIHNPCAFIPHIPFTRFVRGNNMSKIGSDHFPVGCIGLVTGKNKDAAPRVLPWIAEHPLFLKNFAEHWKPQHTDNPQDDMTNIKDTIYAASIRTGKKVREEGRTLTSHLDKLTASISLLRTCIAQPFNLSNLNRKRALYPSLAPLISLKNGKIEWHDLENHLNALINDNFVECDEPLPFTTSHGNSLPISTNRAGKSKQCIAKELKKALPCNRSRLPGLRQRLPGKAKNDPAGYTDMTNDPTKMSMIAKQFWGVTWSKVKGSKRKRRFVKRYLHDGGHDPCFLRMPTEQDIIDIILSTKNTSPGPDGIPFVVYRMLAAHVAPIFLRLLKYFAEGHLPSEGFNDALLFLLPKKSTFTAADTRPISVANTENRILGKIMVWAIAPYLSDENIIGPAQKGSIAGRWGADHIRQLNEKYYRSVEHPELYGDYYVFFMDTKKAFDSIHHDFLFDVLLWIGLPVWVVNVVRAMLHKVKVTPFLGKRTGVWIKIRRGVKQGCPLSPWIFAVCMQALLFKLGKVSDIDPLAYVDDLAIGSPNYKRFAKCMRTIFAFSMVSGLGVNFDKTRGLASGSAVNFEKWISTCPWPEFKVIDKYVYLGIMFGRWVTARDIYAVAFDKYQERLRSVLPAMRTMTPSRRTLVINIFLTSLFSYIAPFHAIPNTGKVSLTTVRSITAKAVISFGGTAFQYNHLTAPTSQFGLSYPLKDLWAYSVVTLAVQYDFSSIEGVTALEEKGVSNRISESIEANAFDLVRWHLKAQTIDGQPYPSFKSSDFEGGNTPRNRAKLYKILILAKHKHDKRDNDIERKLSLRGLTSSPLHVQHNHKVFSGFRKQLPAPVRYHQLAMVCNAVVTARRTRFFVEPKEIRSRIGEERIEIDGDIDSWEGKDRCRACGSGRDDITHYYDGSCEVAVRARNSFGRIINYPLDHHTLRATYLNTSYLFLPRLRAPQHPETGTQQQMTLPPPNHNNDPHYQATIHAIAIFNWAFWLACIKFFSADQAIGMVTHTADQVISKVTRIATSAWARTRANAWKRPNQASARSLGINLGVSGSRLGSTSNRSSEQKELARKIAESQIQAVPPGAAIIFTDGSADSEGNAGAAAVALMPRHREGGTEAGRCLIATQSFSTGTNNITEMWAIGMGLQMLTFDSQRTNIPFEGDVYIFTDSALSADIIAHRAVPKTNTALCHAVRALANTVNSTNHTHMRWIAGHVGVVGNEIADRKAGEAAKRAADGYGLSIDSYERRVAGSNFLPTQRPHSLLHDWRPP